MRQILILAILALSSHISFSQTADSSAVVLRGKIVQPNSDSLELTDDRNQIISVIHLNAQNEFYQSVEIEGGYYQLSDGTEYLKLYLKPGFNLKIFLHTAKFDETLRFDGNGADCNNFLIKKLLLSEEIGIREIPAYHYYMVENEFVAYQDSVRQAKIDLLNAYESLDPDFRHLETHNINFEYAYRLEQYPYGYRMLRKDSSFQLSKNFPDPYQYMILDDKKLYVLESFWRLADAYVRMDMEKEMNKPKGYRGLDKIEIYYNYDLKLGSMAAKEWAMNYELDDSVKVEALAEYMKIVKNEKFKKELKDLYEYFSDTEEDEIFTAEELMLEVDAFEDFDKKQAEPAVPFALKDANSKPYALSTFKGKYLYINIWSYLSPVSMLASHEMEAV
jgi:hypothetical protein